LDSDSSAVSLTITTPTICYSDVSEWILDTGATYHICPKRDWFASSEKLDGGLVQMGDDSTCRMDRVGTVLVKMFDEMVRKLKDERYFPQMKNLISIEALKAQDLEFSDRDGVLKMLKGSMLY